MSMLSFLSCEGDFSAAIVIKVAKDPQYAVIVGTMFQTVDKVSRNGNTHIWSSGKLI